MPIICPDEIISIFTERSKAIPGEISKLEDEIKEAIIAIATKSKRLNELNNEIETNARVITNAKNGMYDYDWDDNDEREGYVYRHYVDDNGNDYYYEDGCDTD